MAKKQDSFYYDKFIQCIDFALRAAELLNTTMKDFRPEELLDNLSKMHELEHGADEVKHELLQVMAKAFITPIEREDIILLSGYLDDVTDKIEDVMQRIYCNNIQTIREDAIEISEILITCCKDVKKLLTDFAQFKKSQAFQKYIIEVNTLEEIADRKFLESLRKLHTNTTDPTEIIVWREIYIYLEQCVDACEHVADTVESVVMKNM